MLKSEYTEGARQNQDSGGSAADGSHSGVGLSTVTYFTAGDDLVEEEEVFYGKVEVAKGGRFSKISRRMGGQPSAGGGKRGVVEEFSRGSRRRLIQKFNSIDRGQVDTMPLFVTLTYPAEWPREGKEWKRHLDNFLKRVRRKYPEACGIWRLEFQRRGAPHFHLLVFGVSYISHEWVAQAWYEVVKSGDKKHLRAGTETRAMRSWGEAGAYVSKYIAKAAQGASECDYPGRFWGVFNRKEFAKLIEFVEAVLERPEFYQLRRIAARWLAKRGYSPRLSMNRGVAAFVTSTEMLRLLRWMGCTVDD